MIISCRKFQNLFIFVFSLSLVHEKGGGSFLASRTWSGVEQKLGETEVSGVVQGRKGIAAGYEGEGENT